MDKSCTTVSETPSLSTSFSLHEAMLTHAQATVEGKNAENLQSETETNNKVGRRSSGWNSCRVGVGGRGRGGTTILDTP